MKKIKIAILSLAVIASVGGAFASKNKFGSQTFFVQGNFANLSALPSNVNTYSASFPTCGTSSAAVCTVITKSDAPDYSPGDVILKTDIDHVVSLRSNQ